MINKEINKEMNKKYRIYLSFCEKVKLEALISKGTEKSRKISRARILVLADENNPEKHKDIAKFLQTSDERVTRICKTYVEEGLESALNEKKRSGRPEVITGEDQAKIIALACSKAPEGYARWTLRLLSEKSIELNLTRSISHDKIGDILKKTNLSLI